MPISHDSEYFLDGMVSLLETTPDIGCGAHISQLDIDAIIDQRQEINGEDGNCPNGLFNTQRTADAITEAVLQWRKFTATPFQRQLMALSSLTESSGIMTELLFSVSGPIAEAYLFKKGLTYPSIVAYTARKSSLADISIANIQSLRELSVVEAVVNRDRLLQNYIKMLSLQHLRITETIKEIDFNQFSIELREFRQHHFELIAERREAIQQALNNAESIKLLALKKKEVKLARKAIRRGLKTIEQIVDKTAYKAFISNEGYVINGCEFDYKVKKTYSLVKHTMDPTTVHIPYNLTILNKSGDSLGNGCIIFKDTPVLDQIIGLTLHVRDKELERDVVKTANWSQITENGRKDQTFITYSARKPSSGTIHIDLDDIQVPVLSEIMTVKSPFMRYRKNIMDIIKPNVHGHLATITKIPKEIYTFMCNPTFILDELADYDHFDRSLIDNLIRYF